MRVYIIIAIVTFTIGFATCQQFFKPEPEVRTVIKEVKVRDTDAHTDVETHIVKHPDGTIVTDIKRDTDVHSETKSNTSTFQEVHQEQPNWSVGIYAANQHTFIGTIDRRIFGGLSVGIYGRFDGSHVEPGIGIRLEF